MRLDLLLYNVQLKLKAQISRSYLGCLWWIIEPIGVISAFYFVFEFLLKRGGPEYTYQLVIGVVIWTWFGATSIQAANSIHGASTLMQQVKVNKLLFPLSDVLELSFKQIFVFLLLLFFLITTKGVQSSWSYIPLLILVQFIFITGISLAFSAIVPFLPDTIYLIHIFMRLWMFCSGVFYTVDSISPSHQFLFLLNPMANLIDQYRTVLITGLAPDWLSLMTILIGSFIIIGFSALAIKHNDQTYPRLSLQ
ncbi:MAG: ABC transporter permease [Pseudomonadales bacterium]|nr:ABC transporter permease [Pseudomonadales bacterium]